MPFLAEDIGAFKIASCWSCGPKGTQAGLWCPRFTWEVQVQAGGNEAGREPLRVGGGTTVSPVSG